MIDERYIELINRKIDGSITGSEQADLERYLSVTPGARELHDAMVRLSVLPQLLPPVNPPQEMKQRILNEITATNRRPAVARRSFTEFLSVIQARLDFKFAYGFAAGLLIGVAACLVTLTNLGQQGELSFTDLAGTIGIEPETGRHLIVDEDAFEREGFAGAIKTGAAGNLVFIRLHIQSGQDVEVVFEYEPENMHFQGYRQLTQQTGALEVRPGKMEFSHVGEDEYVLIFNRKSLAGSVISCVIRADHALYERQIVISQSED